MSNFADIDFRLSLRPRANNGQAIDFTPWVERLERRKSLRDTTVGVWSAELAFGDDYQSREAERLLRSRVRDNDWGELELTDRTNGARSVWEILTDARDRSEVYAPDASAGRSWGLHGRDWAKCLVDGEVRLGAFFQSANVTDAQILGATEGADTWFSDAEDNFSLYVAQTVVIPPKMPGFVDFETWDKLMRAAAEGSALGMTASKPLREILAILLWGMWVDPDGQTLLAKLHDHGWSQFGPVAGCPWQLMNLTAQQTVTPDRVLRQYGNLDFNEIIYSQNPDNGAPRIIYRPRPFLPAAWSRLPMTNLVGDGSRVLTVNVSQSGAERLTYYRPNAVAAGIHGLDVIMDTRTGRLPIIERSQLKYHGVRPGEPTDDLWPPADKASGPMLEWFRRRIGIFRRWYYWNAEYLSGTLSLSPADPRVQVGTRVLFPCEWEFQLGGGRYVKTQVVEAYVTDVADTVSDSEGGRETATQVSIIRGQPPGGLPVPAVERWTSGAKRITQVVSAGRVERGSGAYVVVHGQQIGVPFSVTHSTALLVGGVYTPRTTAPIALIVHQTGGTSPPDHAVGTYPPKGTAANLIKRRASTHFIITQDGTLWQFLDPWSHTAWSAAGDGDIELNATSWALDFTGTARSGFTYAQKATFLALLQVVIPAIPFLLSPMPGRAPVLRNWPLRFVMPNNPPPAGDPQVTETPAQWATRERVVPGQTPGMYAHQQLQANRSDPSSPANDPTWWDELRAGVFDLGY